MIYTLFLFFAFVLQGFICSLFFSTIAPCRYSFRCTFALHFPIQIFTAFLNVAFAHAAPMPVFLLIASLFLIEVLWLCKTTLLLRIIIFLIWLLGSFFMEVIATSLFMLLFEQNYAQMMQHNLLRIILTLTMTFAFGFYFAVIYLLKKRSEKKISLSKAALLLLFPIGQAFLLCCLIFGVVVQHFNATVLSILYVGLAVNVLADIILVKVMLALEEKAKLELLLQTAAEVAALQMQQYADREQQNQKFAAIKHDYKNHMATMIRLANDPTTENLLQIQRLGQAVCDELSEPHSAQYTSHRIANAVITAKAEQCEKLDIAFSCEASFPSNLCVTDLHLCSVLSNLLDNAIHGVQNLPSAQRRIVFKAAQRGGFLYLHTENPFDDAKTKKGTGLGLCILRDIAATYEGDLIQRQENKMFYVLVSLRT